jgi:large subunit ribosomal protein L15
MRLNEIADNPGARKPRKRVGRGIGSGKGKTAGAGVKGQKARAGVAVRNFEGGQMPIYRRLPKRGFTNLFGREHSIVNIGEVQRAIDANKLDAGKPIDQAALVAARLVRPSRDGVRLLAKGELTAKAEFVVAGASKAAQAAVEKAGGTVTLTQPAASADAE